MDPVMASHSAVNCASPILLKVEWRDAIRFTEFMNVGLLLSAALSLTPADINKAPDKTIRMEMNKAFIYFMFKVKRMCFIFPGCPFLLQGKEERKVVRAS